MDPRHATPCTKRAVHAKDVPDAMRSRPLLLPLMISCHLHPTIMASMDIH